MKRPAARHVLKKPARHVLKKPARDERKKPASALTTVKGGVCNPKYICFLSERTPTCLSRAGFISRLKAFVGTTVPRQHVEIGLSRREKNADQSSVFIYRIYCRSCKKCSVNKGWTGRATYDTSNCMMTLRALPISAHGAFDRTQNAAEHGLLPQEKRVVIQTLQKGGPVTVQRLLHNLAERLPNDALLPSETAVGYFMKNHRFQNMTKTEKKNLAPWSIADLSNMCRSLPTLSSENLDTLPLVLVSSHLEEGDVSIICCNTSLFRSWAGLVRLCDKVSVDFSCILQ